jgi:iron complex outermembrane receptor protein
LANGGDAYSRGFELEGSIAPVEGLRIGYNAAYTKGALTSLLPGAPTFLLGYQLPYVPKFTGAVNADYGWALRGDWRASVGGGVHYVGEAWTASPGVGFTTKNAAYATADLRAGLSNDRYSINLFVHNVTDKLVYLQQAPLQNLLTGALTALNATPLQPRVVGISFDATF